MNTARETVADLIAASGRTAADLSTAIGRSRDYLGDYLAGRKSSIAFDAAIALAGELGVAIEKLAGR